MLCAMSSRIEVLYRVQSDAKSIAARAKAIAVEQSVEMPVEPIDDPYVLSEIVGRVDEITDLGGGRFDVRIALASITTGFEAGQLLNMIIGNTSMQEDVALLDARFPEEFADGFGGPRHGLAGLRARVKAKGALTCSALKPQGFTVAALAKLAGRIVAGGIDYLKDDHGIADQSYSPFELGMGKLVRFDKADYVGRRALQAEQAAGGPARRLVGLQLDWYGIERLYDAQGLPPAISPTVSRSPVPVYAAGRQVGKATSHGWSPILKQALAIAFVTPRFERSGSRLEIEWTVEGRRGSVDATVVELPFLDLPRKRA